MKSSSLKKDSSCYSESLGRCFSASFKTSFESLVFLDFVALERTYELPV